MKAEKLHNWQLNINQALETQRQLQAQISRSGRVVSSRFIDGVDILASKARRMAQAVVIVLSYSELRLVETVGVQGELAFFCIPGLLSFRESPLILAACQKLLVTSDIILIDGQGVAHPRRIGLPCHLGLFVAATAYPAIGQKAMLN